MISLNGYKVDQSNPFAMTTLFSLNWKEMRFDKTYFSHFEEMLPTKILVISLCPLFPPFPRFAFFTLPRSDISRDQSSHRNNHETWISLNLFS